MGSPSARATAADRCRSSSDVARMSITNPVSHWLRKNANRTLRRPSGVCSGRERASRDPRWNPRDRARLGDRIHHTPLLSSATAARVAGEASGARLADGQLYLKAEHLQKTGSFKPRAALSRIESLTPDERRRGAITISAGNAGQAYAWAGREAGVPVTVVMPAGAVASKVAACLEYGAEVVLHGTHVGEAMQRMTSSRGAPAHDRPSLRPARGPARQRLLWPRAAGGPARRRCRRDRRGRRRAAGRGHRRAQGVAPLRPGVRRRAGRLRGARARARGRGAGAGDARQRRGRARRADRRPAGPRRGPALSRRIAAGGRPDHPRRPEVRARAPQAGPGARGRRGPRGSPHRRRPAPRRRSGCRDPVGRQRRHGAARGAARVRRADPAGHHSGP